MSFLQVKRAIARSNASLLCGLRMSTTTWFGVICTTLILCLEAEAGLSGVPSWLEGDRCYELDISLCRTYGYNQTALPNSFGQRTEIEAVFHLGALLPLIESGCSSELRFLLCIIYLPVCLRDPNSDKLLDIQPCHQLCRRVYNSCVSTAARMGSDWPATFNCTDLPDADNRDHICFNQAPGLPYTEGLWQFLQTLALVVVTLFANRSSCISDMGQTHGLNVCIHSHSNIWWVSPPP